MDWKLLDKNGNLLELVNCQYDALDIATMEYDAIEVYIDFEKEKAKILRVKGDS